MTLIDDVGMVNPTRLTEERVGTPGQHDGSEAVSEGETEGRRGGLVLLGELSLD